MDLDQYQSTLRRKIALYTKYEKDDLDAGKEDAAYIAKSIADAYKDALEISKELEF